MPEPNVAASELHLDFEWLDPGGAKGQELRATWASLSIRVNDSPVTKFEDQKIRSVRTQVFLPLFPLAEWIVDNWWFLQSEVEKPDTASPIEFDRRHNLRWAREGFVLPSLRFVSVGENVAADWQPWEISGAAIRFLSSGTAVLPARSFSETLRDFVNTVVSRLDESGLTETTLHKQWLEIENAEADERAFCLASARLGADPYAIDNQTTESIFNASDRIRAELLDDFLSLASLDHLNDQASALESASESIASDDDDTDALAAVRARTPMLSNGSNPWEIGYQFAAKLRSALNGGNWKSRSIVELAGHLSIDQLDHCLLPETGEGPLLDALTGTNQCDKPKFIIEKKREDSRQFAFCRALFEHLTLPQGRFAAVSKLRTDRQQMNRAFAAEFLAPSLLLKKDLSAASVGEDEIEDLSADYGVSAFVVRHQIENHQLARISP